MPGEAGMSTRFIIRRNTRIVRRSSLQNFWRGWKSITNRLRRKPCFNIEQPMKDYFISYNRADRTWAEWIAWQLESAGYTTVLQAWDFRPGGNFVIEMQRTTAEAERTLAVLSPDYIAARFTQPEWAAAFAQDPTSEKGTLLPMRVREMTGGEQSDA